MYGIEVLCYFISAAIIVASVYGIIIMRKIKDRINLQNTILEIQIDYEHGKRDNELFQTENVIYDTSRKLLDFTKDYISQVTVLKVKTFVDTNDMKMVTREKIKNLITDIATGINESINRENIDLDCLYFTKEFYDNFIVETTIIMVKELLEREIDNYDPGLFEGVNNIDG